MGLFDWLYESEDPEDYIGGSIPSPEEETLPEDPYNKFLKGFNETVGGIFGTAKKPIDWLASHEVGPDILSTNPVAVSAALAREASRPVETKPAEEILADALFPKRLPGDVVNVAPTFSRMGPVTEPRPATEEEKVVDEVARGILRKGTTTVGSFALNPATYALGLGGVPSKVVAAGFLPGISQGFGEDIGKAISASENKDIPGMAENIFGAGLNALFLGGMATHLAGKEVPKTSEVKQSEAVTETPIERNAGIPNPELKLETAAPKPEFELGEIPEQNVPHIERAKELTDVYLETLKPQAAKALGDERYLDTKIEYEPNLRTMIYDRESNTIYIDPELLLTQTPKQTAKDIIHELGHGPEEASHQILGAKRGAVEGEDITGAKTTEVPLEALPENTADLVIDAGELGLKPEELGPELVSVIEAGRGEHREGNMLPRAQAGGAREQTFLDTMDAIANTEGTAGLAEQYENALHGIVREAKDVGIRAQGETPARSYEEILAEIQNAPASETGAPKAGDIERTALEQYAREQSARVQEAGRRFSEAKTEAEKAQASKEFQEAKAERDKVQARITQLGGGKVEAPKPARPNVEQLIEQAKKESAERKVEPAKNQAEVDAAHEKLLEEVKTESPSEQVVSAEANNLRRLLEGMGLTRFNIDRLPENFKEAGLEVPENLKAELPRMIKELKDRGWVNEKIGGTYTLLTAPPKVKTGGKIEVTNLREQLEKSVEATKPAKSEPVTEPELTPEQIREQKRQAYARSKGIDLSKKETGLPKKEAPSEGEIDIDLSGLDKAIEATGPAPKEKLTPDELAAIAKLFGGETKRKGTSETPQEVLDAQKAALRGLVEQEKKGGEGEGPGIEEVGEGPSRMYDVTLSDGTTHKVKATTPEEAQARAEEVLNEYKSTKKVDKVEPSLSSLEKAAKYEIEPVREATETISEEVKDIKQSRMEEAKETGAQIKYSEKLAKEQLHERQFREKQETKEASKLGKQEEKLRAEQRKEKFAEKPYTINLSNGRVVTVRARNEQVARSIVESRIKAKKSEVEIQGIAEKPSALDEAITGAGRKLEESGFTQNPVVRILNAVKSITFGGDVGHLLRQGKQINADLLFSKHAKKVLDQFPVLWKLAKGGMKELEGLNEKLYADKDIKSMVDDFGLDMPGMGKGLKEEAFHGAGLAEKLPVIGKHYVERSEAVYTGGLNYLRSAFVKKEIEGLRKEGLTPDNAPERYHALARAANIISQRGQFNAAYQKLFSDASAVMGAPRAKAARLQNAVELFRGGSSGRIVRRTAAKTMAFNLGLYGLLKATTGATFISDPESSDYLKIRISPKITVDPWMGLGVTARSVAAFLGDRRKSPYKKTKKGEAYAYPVKPSEILTTEFLSGLSPGVRAAIEMYKGTDLRGFQIDRVKSLRNLGPLGWTNIVDLAEAGDIDEALELSMLTLMGEGVNVFDYEKAQAEQRRLKMERGLPVGKSKGRRAYPF